MPNDQAEAIVLRTAPLGDQDKLAVLFCRDKGLLRGVAKGARKFGNRFGSSLEPMSVVRAFYHEKERRELVVISGCDLLESFFEIQAEPATAFLLTYFAELIEEFAPARAREEVLFRLLLSVLRCLKDGGDREFAAAYFEAWFLHANGLLPDLSACRKCGRPLAPGWLAPGKDGAFCPDCAPLRKEEVPAGTAAFLRWTRRNPPPGDSAPPFPAEDVARIRRTLQAAIVHHMEREPRTLQFLKAK
ncbi:MAG TPA: DNA repair protein RecO [Candidatus Aminicenantes bacterium]|mgnify:CR=1 FL=1|nr:DNA repair protein RecO [Candidatus Aminicenantes bacterium]